MAASSPGQSVDGPPLLFLSHAGEETEPAKKLAQQLRSRGLDVWLDVERLPGMPGCVWQREIEKAVMSAHAFMVWVGAAGVDGWVEFETRLALCRAAKEAHFRLIPVLGPGSDSNKLPPFLKLFQWINLCEGLPAEQLQQEVAARLKQPVMERPLLAPDRPPFVGLHHFDLGDAVLFFGREEETEELLGCLHQHPFLLVVGKSGCGKSSLVRAGLIPALRRGRFDAGRSRMAPWRITISRPVDDPFRELAENLCDLNSATADRKADVDSNRKLLSEGTEGLRSIIAGSVPAGTRTLLVIDQFEELFTSTESPATRRRFLDSLERAATLSSDRPVHVIATLGAEFYAHCWEHEKLLEHLARDQYPVPAIPVQHLSELIEKPLGLAGLKAEPGLLQTILKEVGNEPGSLALLEHALDQLWRRRSGAGLITFDAYEAIGRLAGALGRHADDVMASLPDDSARALARRFFVDLTQVVEGAPDTRRRVAINDLLSGVERPDRARLVLETLARERLITTSQDYAEVAHEALIREWEELVGWVEEGRQSLHLVRRLQQEAHEWKRSNCQPRALLAGDRLAEAKGLLKLPIRVDMLILEFINASAAEATRRKWRRRMFRVALAITLLVASAGVWSWYQAQRLAHREKLHVQALQLAAQAELMIVERNASVEPSTLLAIESIRRADLFENDYSLRAKLDLLPRSCRTLRHEGSVAAVAFSPDGRRVVTGSRDGTARVWEAQSGREIARLTHQAGVLAVAFSPDGRRVATASADSTARIWDTNSGEEKARLTHESAVWSVTFSRDGRRVATASGDETARVWDADSGAPLVRLTHQASVVAVVFSPDGHRLATASGDGTARVWDAKTGRQTALLRHHDAVYAVAFSPDGQQVATASGDGTARIWQARTGRELTRLTHQSSVVAVTFSPDGRRVLTGSRDSTARVWETDSGREIARLSHQASVLAVAFSPDSRKAATGSYDDTARVWEVEGGRELARLSHEKWVGAVAFSPDGQRILTASGDDTARVWEAQSGRALAQMSHEDAVLAVIFSPDGRHLVTGSRDRTARVWNVETGTEIARLTHQARVLAVAVSPDGQRVATGSYDNTARIWEARSGRELARLNHEGAVVAVAFSRDGRRLVTGSDDNTARIWDTLSGMELARLTHQDSVVAVAFSPNGLRVATASDDKTARVWEVQSGKELASLTHQASVVAVAFSPDGRHLATGSWDSTARLWEVDRGKELARLTHQASVVAVAFSPDGRRVVTVSGDNTTRIWDAERGRELVRLTHEAGVVAASFSADGRRVLTVSSDDTARVWEAGTGREARRLSHLTAAALGPAGSVDFAAFSLDGKLLATASGQLVAVHYVQPADLIRQACAHLTRNLTELEWNRYIGNERYRKTCEELP